MVEEKKEKIIENLVFQKNPKPFNVVKCKLMDETIRGEYGDLFPLGNKLIVRLKTPIYWFFLASRQFVYHPLLKIHKYKIKINIVRYNSIVYVCRIFVLPIDPDNLDKIAKEKPRSWVDIANSIFFLLGDQHIVMAIRYAYVEFEIFCSRSLNWKNIFTI